MTRVSRVAWAFWVVDHWVRWSRPSLVVSHRARAARPSRGQGASRWLSKSYSPPARVVLNTFKRYGIVLADGGTVALTAESDLYTTTDWSDLGIDSRIFDQTPGAPAVSITDFDVIDTGDRIAETYDCVPTMITPALFSDDFESGGLSAWSVVVP